MADQLYYIASVKHTEKYHEHITWWGKDHRGYTPVVDHIGTYGHDEAMRLNDGIECVAVPVQVVQELLSPEPCWKPGARFYEQRGPVVDNTRASWASLVRGSNPQTTPKPRTFRGNRRSFAWAEDSMPTAERPREAARA